MITPENNNKKMSKCKIKQFFQKIKLKTANYSILIVKVCILEIYHQ